MKRQNLIFESFKGENCQTYRSIIKTSHGRLIYIEIKINNGACHITDCYYIDRFEREVIRPLKLKTYNFKTKKILDVIEQELDRKYYGIDFVNIENEYLNTRDYINIKLSQMTKKYRFLIFIGEGKTIGDLPVELKTRFKNKLHRCIYLKLQYHDNVSGVITDCHYYDKAYKRNKVTPRFLNSIFFDYNRKSILEFINKELTCDFTDIIIITDNSIDIDNNLMPLCGSI